MPTPPITLIPVSLELQGPWYRLESNEDTSNKPHVAVAKRAVLVIRYLNRDSCSSTKFPSRRLSSSQQTSPRGRGGNLMDPKGQTNKKSKCNMLTPGMVRFSGRAPQSMSASPSFHASKSQGEELPIARHLSGRWRHVELQVPSCQPAMVL